jgi:hypothetical protein
MKILKDDLASLRENQREFQFEKVDLNFDGIWDEFAIPFFIF